VRFDVIDLNINQSIGNLIDINSDGMRIQSDEVMEIGPIFKLKIDLPEEIKGCDRLIVDARSLWSNKDVDQEFYQTGFEFLEKLPFHNEIIKLLFEKDRKRQEV